MREEWRSSEFDTQVQNQLQPLYFVHNEVRNIIFNRDKSPKMALLAEWG